MVKITKTKEEVIEEFRIQSIQEAAARVIARKGLTGASMQEIAEEAGVAKGTLYLYFRNQQELLAATIDQTLKELRARLDEAFDSPTEFEEKLSLLIRSQLEFFDDNADLFQLHLSTKFAEGADRSATRCDHVRREQYQSYISRLTDLFSDGIEAGALRAGDPRRYALFAQEGTAAVVFQRLSEETPPAIDEEVEWIMNTILHGVAVKRSRRRN